MNAAIDRPVGDEQVQQPVEQGEVGARADLEEQVGLARRSPCAAGRRRSAWRRLVHPVEHAQEQDRVAVGHVRADHEEHVGVVEVVVGARAGRRRRATACSPRRRWPCTAGEFDSIWFVPMKPLASLLARYWASRRHLPGDVQGDRVRTVLVEDPPQPGPTRRDRLVGRRHRRRRRARSRTERVRHPAAGAASMSALVAPLVHSRPRFAGCCLVAAWRRARRGGRRRRSRRRARSRSRRRSTSRRCGRPSVAGDRRRHPGIRRRTTTTPSWSGDVVHPERLDVGVEAPPGAQVEALLVQRRGQRRHAVGVADDAAAEHGRARARVDVVDGVQGAGGQPHDRDLHPVDQRGDGAVRV